MSVLDKIVARKREEVAALKRAYPRGFSAGELSRSRGSRRSLRAALEAASRPRIIAEVKKASPSAGTLRPDFDPLEIAGQYAAAGAAAVSVVTDRDFFQGNLEWVGGIRKAVPLPVLRKEFIIDSLQLEETRAAGADAVLLIAALLSAAELRSLLDRAAALDLECLVEVRDRDDVAKVNEVKPELVGINNRDLKDFSIDLGTSLGIVRELPADTVVVSESGIETAADIARLRAGGINAFLIGTSLVRAADRGRLLRELIDGR